MTRRAHGQRGTEARRKGCGLCAAFGAVIVASWAQAVCAQAPPPPPQPRVTIGYVEIAGAARYEPITGYGRLVLQRRARPFAGAPVGLDEGQAIARVLKIDFALERISVAAAGERAGAGTGARAAVGVHCSIAGPAADACQTSAGPVRGRDVLVFNAAAADDALRRNPCAREVVRTLPSLAMGMHALVQYLASRKSTNLLVFGGPHA